MSKHCKPKKRCEGQNRGVHVLGFKRTPTYEPNGASREWFHKGSNLLISRRRTSPLFNVKRKNPNVCTL